MAETAYIVPVSEGRWKLRWFTPTVEVPLCGHATLASAHVLWKHLGFEGTSIIFETVKSGELIVERTETGYVMDFPKPAVEEIEVTDDVVEALGARPVTAYGGAFFAGVFETPEQIVALNPDLKALAGLDGGGNRLREHGPVRRCRAQLARGLGSASQSHRPSCRATRA